MTSRNILAYNLTLSFSIKEKITFSSEEKRIIHADIDIIAVAELETEAVKASENETLSEILPSAAFLFSGRFPVCLFDITASDNAVITDDRNTETRTDAPDETEFNTVIPTVFIINPGPEFTLYEISLRTVA